MVFNAISVFRENYVHQSAFVQQDIVSTIQNFLSCFAHESCNGLQSDILFFLLTVFMALTPIMICSAVLAFLMIKELDQKDKEKKKKSKKYAAKSILNYYMSYKLIT